MEGATVCEGGHAAREGAGTHTGLRICIVSRKQLDRVTRIVRMARALVDAGHTVTVISMKPPCDELRDTVPEVEFHEAPVVPWTRQKIIDTRQEATRRAGARKQRDRAWRSDPPPVWRRRLVLGQERLRDGLRSLGQKLVVAPVTGFLLKTKDERLLDKVRIYQQTDKVGLVQGYMQQFAQIAVTDGFRDQVVERLGDRRFDYVQAHDNYALEPAQSLARVTGAQLVYDAVEISEHRLALNHSRFARILERVQRRRERRTLKQSRFMITIGDGLADWYATRYRIPRPVPIRNCRPFWPYRRRDDIRRDCGVGPETPLVTWFGYAYPDQGLPQIIDAAAHIPEHVHFALLVDTLPRWKTFLEEELPQRAADRGVTERIHFLPARQPNELISYVSGADIGIIPRPNVSPNVYYSMPNKFMEMVMARLPITVSNLVDMRTLIERFDIGAIFDVTDPADIGHILMRQIEPERLAQLRDNIETAAQTLTWEYEGSRFVQCYEAAEMGRKWSEIAEQMQDRLSVPA